MEENKTTVTEETAEVKTEEPKEQKKDKKVDKKELLKEIETLKAELAEKDDKYLRMAAEYDNFRRRSREERDALYETALSDTVAEILPIIDNLERASLYDDGEKVKEGLLLTAKSTISIFEKLGIEDETEASTISGWVMEKTEKIPQTGDTFDYGQWHAVVLKADDRHVQEIRLTHIQAS